MHPATIGPFQIQRELGRGGMGVVYLATDTKLDRQVAIKALPADLAAEPDRLTRFQREAKVLASLNHTNVGSIYGLEQADGHQYLVLEYIEGQTLADRLVHGPIPFGETLALAKQIAEAVEAAHEKSIIHRDLKPSNVMVTPDGLVKVLDFGLAHIVDGSPASTNAAAMPDSPTVVSPVRYSPTIPGVIMGTAGYMSPEQALGKPVDKRSDIFSFGCVLYEMLSGRQPFGGETVTDSLGAILHREPDWSVLPTDTPRSIRQLLKRCLTKDRKHRLHDIADARLELDAAILDPAPLMPVTNARRQWREALAWLLLVLVAIGAGAMSLVMRHRVPPGPSAFHQLNVRPEAVFRALFAPDGKTVVYSAAGEGNTPDLFVVRPESHEPQLLAKQTHLLSVSSKGDLAVLTSANHIFHRLFTGTLARVPLGGGAPRPLIENVREADWAPDGERLAIIRVVDGKDRLEFPVGTVLKETSGYFSDLRFHPSGDRIAFFEHPLKYDNRGEVNVVDLRGQSKVLTGTYPWMEGLTWSSDGREVMFSASVSGDPMRILAVTEDGALRTLLAGPGMCVIYDTNKDDRWLFSQTTERYSVMVRTPDMNQEREFSWLGSSNRGLLSRDGRTLAFFEQVAAMGPNYGACVRGTDGSPVQYLGEGIPSSFSYDGKWLLTHVPSTPPALVAYPLGVGDPVRLNRGELEQYGWHTKWFRDGTRVLGSGSEPGKTRQWYIQEFPNGAPRPVTPQGVTEGLLTPDERGVLAKGPGAAWAIYPIDGTAPDPVKGLTEHDFLLGWCPDGVSVLTERGKRIPRLVERVNIQTGLREPFLTLAPTDLSGVLAISSVFFSEDLQSYTYTCVRSVSKLFVTENAK